MEETTERLTYKQKLRKMNDRVNKWKRENTKSYKLMINRSKHPETVDWLDAKANVSAYLMGLIEDDMRKGQDGKQG